jgi:RNA polymerase sigma-70 factor (ECF subfamily)
VTWSRSGGAFGRESPPDALLARLVAAGDAVAFHLLYERHARGIYLLGCPLLGREGASDLVQDVFTIVWEKAHQFDEQRGAFRTWLTAIARHRLLDLSRHRAREAQTLATGELADQIEQLVDERVDVAEEAVWGIETERVLHSLGALPPLQRRALLLAYFGAYTHRELAELLDWPLGTVKKRIRLGLHKLAAELGHLQAEPLAAQEEGLDEL